MAKKGTRKVKTDAEKAADFKKFAAKHGNSILRGFEKLGKLGARFHADAEIVKELQSGISEAGDAAFEALKGKKTASAGFEF